MRAMLCQRTKILSLSLPFLSLHFHSNQIETEKVTNQKPNDLGKRTPLF